MDDAAISLLSQGLPLELPIHGTILEVRKRDRDDRGAYAFCVIVDKNRNAHKYTLYDSGFDSEDAGLRWRLSEPYQSFASAIVRSNRETRELASRVADLEASHRELNRFVEQRGYVALCAKIDAIQEERADVLSTSKIAMIVAIVAILIVML